MKARPAVVFEEDFERRVKAVTTKTATEEVRGVLWTFNQCAEVMPRAVYARLAAICRQRLDVTLGELDTLIKDPERWTGTIPRYGGLIKPGWLAQYLAYTDQHEAPEEFHFWIGVAIVGASLGRRVAFARGYHAVYPNHYVVLVAPPGRCRKSGAIEVGQRLLMEAQSAHILAEKSTPEGLAEALEEIGGTGIVIAPELTIFLGRQQYNEGLIDALTRLYDCPPEYKYKTRTKGTIAIPEPTLSLLGGTTPDKLTDALPQMAIGGGFTSRVLFVVKTDTPRLEPRVVETNKYLRSQLLSGLITLGTVSGRVLFSEDADDWWDPWYRANRAQALEADQRMSYYYERKPEYVIRLAIVLAVTEQQPGRLMTWRIDADMLRRASAGIEYLEQALPDAFAGVEASPSGRESIRVLGQVKKRGGAIEWQILMQQNLRFMDKDRLEKVVKTLVMAGLVDVDTLSGAPVIRLTDRGKVSV